VMGTGSPSVNAELWQYCVDTDGGQIFTQKGEVTWRGGDWHAEDTCEGNTLYEQYCEGSEAPRDMTYECPGVCEAGRCYEVVRPEMDVLGLGDPYESYQPLTKIHVELVGRKVGSGLMDPAEGWRAKAELYKRETVGFNSTLNKMHLSATPKYLGNGTWALDMAVPFDIGQYHLSLGITCSPENGCPYQDTGTSYTHEFYVERDGQPRVGDIFDMQRSYLPGQAARLKVSIADGPIAGSATAADGWKTRFTLRYNTLEGMSGDPILQGDAVFGRGTYTWMIDLVAPQEEGDYQLGIIVTCRHSEGCKMPREWTGSHSTDFFVRRPAASSSSSAAVVASSLAASTGDASSALTTISIGAASTSSFAENAPGSANVFRDVDPQSAYGKAAIELSKRGIISGYPDGRFGGGLPVNRAEAAKFLLSAAGVQVSVDSGSLPFWDIDAGQWYVPYVVAAARAGIIKGHPDGSFHPADQVNTAEFLTMLTKTFSLQSDLPYSYFDVQAGDWFAPFAGVVPRYGLFPNRSPQYLQPGRALTRDEVAHAIHQILLMR